MSTLIKVGAGVVGLTTVTTASYFIRDYQNTDRIYKRINNSGMTLLNYYEKEEEGAKRGKDYLDDKTNVGKLKDLNKDKVPKEFKDKCYYNTSTAIEGNEKLFGEIEKYCTKSFKLADLINEEKGIKLIESGDDTGFMAAGQKYYDTKYGKQRKDPLDIKSSARKDAFPQEYKENCNKKSNKQIKSKRDGDFSIVREGCTKAG